MTNTWGRAPGWRCESGDGMFASGWTPQSAYKGWLFWSDLHEQQKAMDEKEKESIIALAKVICAAGS